MEDFIIFAAVFVMIIVPTCVLMWATGKQLNEHEEGIRDLKARVKELEGKIPNGHTVTAKIADFSLGPDRNGQVYPADVFIGAVEKYNEHLEENKPCCQNCKHLIADTCVLHSNDYRCLRCLDNDFKDFEVK